MRLLALIWFSLLTLLGNFTATAAVVRTKVDLVNLTPDVVPGQKILIAARFRCDPHFHIYWKNPGDAGQCPSITWQEKAGLTLSDFFYPGPQLLDLKGVMNFVYENETFLILEAQVPANAQGTLNLKALVEWLECDDAGCYPQQKNVSLTLNVGKGNPAQAFNRKLYPELNPSFTTTAQVQGETLSIKLPEASLTKLWFPEKNIVTPGAVVAQKSSAGTLTMSLKDATDSLQSGPLYFVTQTSEGGFVKIEIKLSTAASPAPTPTNHPPEGHTGSLEWQPWTPAAQETALAAGKIVYIDFTARWCATCQVNKRVYSQSDVAQALAAHDVVLLKADWTRKDAIIAAELAHYGRQGVPFNIFLKKGVPTAQLSEALTGSEVLEALDAVSHNQAYQAQTQSHPFWVWLGLAFGGGVLLNLMPCVFPMIGLKILGFAQEAGSSRRVVILKGLFYSLGVLGSFLILAGLILALKAGGSAVGWGFQMQSPGFVLGTCVLMITLGLSMTGVFEIGAEFAGTAASAESSHGKWGAFLSGVLATAVATPCTAPGLGAALGFALDKERSTPETLLFFFIIGLGMALPYLLLTIFPKLTALLPRPGEWMETLKQAMAFPLFAYALYLLWVLNALVEEAAWVRDASLGLSVIALACWIWGRWGAPHRSDRERRLGKISAAALYLGTLAYLFHTLN